MSIHVCSSWIHLNPLSDSRFVTAQKMKFCIKNFFSKCDQICRKLQIWSYLLRKSLTENFIFCAVRIAAVCRTADSSDMVMCNGFDWVIDTPLLSNCCCHEAFLPGSLHTHNTATNNVIWHVWYVLTCSLICFRPVFFF